MIIGYISALSIIFLMLGMIYLVNKPSKKESNIGLTYKNYLLTISRNGEYLSIVAEHTNIPSFLLIEKELGYNTVILAIIELDNEEDFLLAKKLIK